MPNPTNPNEAEDAERELLIDKLMELDGLIPSTGKRNCEKNGHKKPCNCFFAREREEYGRNADFILADRQAQKQKWVEEVEARAPKTVYTLDEVREMNKHLDSRTQQDALSKSAAIIENNAAWRAALRGESK